MLGKQNVGMQITFYHFGYADNLMSRCQFPSLTKEIIYDFTCHHLITHARVIKWGQLK